VPDRRIRVTPRAQADVDEQADFLLAESGVEPALAFLAALAHVFERLETFPQLGAVWPARHARLVGLRRVLVPEFRLSVFYRLDERWIDVVRVLHHARHLPPLVEDL
jgi:plasmid stabilization system protein ParE